MREWRQQKRSTPSLNGGGSGGGGAQRLGGHTQVQRILPARHEYSRVVSAAHGTEARKDLTTPPWRIWERAAGKEHLLRHFRTLRRVIVMVVGASTAAESEDSSASTPC